MKSIWTQIDHKLGYVLGCAYCDSQVSSATKASKFLLHISNSFINCEKKNCDSDSIYPRRFTGTMLTSYEHSEFCAVCPGMETSFNAACLLLELDNPRSSETGLTRGALSADLLPSIPQTWFRGDIMSSAPLSQIQRHAPCEVLQ